MRTSLRRNVVGLIATSVLVASCARMGEPDDMLLVTSDAVSVFATKQQSITPSLGNRLTVLEPDARVPVLDCIDEGDYSIYKIRLSDGRTGFVSDGDYRLQDRNASDSAWCGAKPRNPQWQRGWANCAGPEFGKFALNEATGPGPELPVFRINHQLVLAVPKKYWPNAGSLGHEPRTCTKLRDVPTAAYLYFYLQGNWSSGYNLNDVPTVDGSADAPRVRPDMVVVRIYREAPEPKWSAEELKQWEQIDRESQQRFNAEAREIAGLKCAAGWCSGPKGSDEMKLAWWQRGASFVEIQANYKSNRYGGTSVWWKAFTSDLAHWRDVDDEVWKLVAEWSVLNAAQAVAGGRASDLPAEQTEARHRSGAESE